MSLKTRSFILIYSPFFLKNHLLRSNKIIYEVIRWQLPNGEIHRDLGPAIESIDGTRYWYQYGERHRDDGPAVTFEEDKEFNQYWIEGKKLTKEKFIKWQLKNKNK